MSIDVMIVGPADGIARPSSIEIMEWLHERWREFEIPYGFIELGADDISQLRARFADDPIAQMLLKKIQDTQTYVESNGHELELPFTIELMVSY